MKLPVTTTKAPKASKASKASNGRSKGAFIGLKIEPELKEILRGVAAKERRSLSAQILIYIERGIRQDELDA